MRQNLGEDRRKLTGPIKPPPKADSQPPKPVKSTSRKADQIRFRRHLFTRMRSAGVQRASVELNHMSPVQRLEETTNRLGQKIMAWDIATNPIAHVSARASSIPAAHIDLPFIPRANFDDFDGSDGIEQNCAITVPADGSLALRGRLIVEFQDAAMDEEPGLQRTQVAVGYGGEAYSAAFNRPIIWHTHSQLETGEGLYGHGLLQVADHEEMVSNQGTAYGQHGGSFDKVPRPEGDVPNLFNARHILLGEPVGIYDVMLQRFSSEGETLIHVCRIK